MHAGPDPAQPLLARLIVFLARYEKDPLDLDARKRIYGVVEAYPGLHLSEIGRRCSMDTNHAKYHLEVLERNDLVSSRKEEGYWRFYPKVEGELGAQELVDAQDKDTLSLLRREVPLHATLVLLDRGEATLGELADAVDVAASTMHYHAGKMEDAGMIESRKEGRQRIVQLSDPEHTARLVIRYEPPDELVKGFLEAFEELSFP